MTPPNLDLDHFKRILLTLRHGILQSEDSGKEGRKRSSWIKPQSDGSQGWTHFKDKRWQRLLNTVGIFFYNVSKPRFNEFKMRNSAGVFDVVKRLP